MKIRVSERHQSQKGQLLRHLCGEAISMDNSPNLIKTSIQQANMCKILSWLRLDLLNGLEWLPVDELIPLWSLKLEYYTLWVIIAMDSSESVKKTFNSHLILF